MLKLQWLQINKFRAVKPGTRLVFSPTFNVLLGQNGTGKTTLLNLVAAVVSSDFTDLQDEEFELEYELISTSGRIRANVRNMRSPDAKMAIPGTLMAGARISEELDAPALSAEFKVSEVDGESEFIILFDGGRVAIRPGDAASGEAVERNASRVTHLWTTLSMGARAWYLKKRSMDDVFFLVNLSVEVEQERENARFDESLGYLEKLKMAGVTFVRSLRGRGVQASGTLVPEVLVAGLKGLAGLEWGAERYALSAEQVPFLKSVTRMLGFESAEAIVELQQSTQIEENELAQFGGARFLFARSGGGRISEQHLSYGQKRMLAFMYYQATARSVVIADELVNGLHHSWIRACIEALEERQVFLTSQNPLLLDYLSFDSPEQVRSTFVLCRWEQGEGGGQMFWEDMSQDAAEDFFASYKVGFQQVGELLQSKGLW
jgi:energy-coupling factor transporter ATP-binding protein EcfA2